MTSTTNWRSELLPKLSGLPLVPCGAGDKFKAPIDPTTGRGMSNWQNQVFTPEEIAAAENFGFRQLTQFRLRRPLPRGRYESP